MQTKMSPQVMNLQVTDELAVAIIQNPTFEFLMTTSEVAKGYDCSEEAFRSVLSRNPDEFIEGKHFLKSSDVLLQNATKPQGGRPSTLWTKRGIIRLGFFIKSSRAKLFRDWAEDLIMDYLQKTYKLPFTNDEVRLVQLVNEYLVIGNVKKIAVELGITAKHVGEVKNGRKRSLRVFEALVGQAKFNKDNGITNGYPNAFVQTSLQLFNS